MQKTVVTSYQYNSNKYNQPTHSHSHSHPTLNHHPSQWAAADLARKDVQIQTYLEEAANASMVGMALQTDCVKMLSKIEKQRQHARLMREEMEESKMLLSLTESQLQMALTQRTEAEHKEKHVRNILVDTIQSLNYRTERYLGVVRSKKELTRQLSSMFFEAIDQRNHEIESLRRELRMEREKGQMTYEELSQRRYATLNPPKKKGKKKLKGKKGKLKGKMKGLLLTTGKGKAKPKAGKAGKGKGKPSRRGGSSSPSRGRRNSPSRGRKK